MLRADDGEGEVLGRDVICKSEAIKREVGYMTQRRSFWEDLSIDENLDFVAVENLLSMPTRPSEALIGKITRYIMVGYIQVGVILIAAHFLRIVRGILLKGKTAGDISVRLWQIAFSPSSCSRLASSVIAKCSTRTIEKGRDCA